MISIDTNILMHAFNTDSPSHRAAYEWVRSVKDDEEVAISEFILTELYVLLRNPAVLRSPLGPADAAEVVQVYRRHPTWRLIGFSTESRRLHDDLWSGAAERDCAFRRIYDARAALTMTAQGVTEFATVNVKDFEGFGFRRVWNPLRSQ